MIEDTTSTHKYFLQGFYSKYIPPLGGGASKQLMRAVPKVSANYLEALERWDTGAVQSLLTQGLPKKWFWCTLLFLSLVFLAVICPALTAEVPIERVLARPWDAANRVATIQLYFSLTFLSTLIVGVLLLARFSPATLNWMLRYLIMFFNVTYPFTSVVGLFWMIIPPYVAVLGRFPFNLSAIPAIVGSILLKFAEFAAVSKLQDASNLDEQSIAMTQKMDKVTLPIKIRAIFKGITTGYNDRYYKHDNSWWTSFGTSGALLWVRRWLLLLVSVMFATAIIAVVHAIVLAVQGVALLIEAALPLAFAFLISIHYIWLCYEPARFVLKGSSLDIAPRFAEVGITILMLLGVIGLAEVQRRLNS